MPVRVEQVDVEREVHARLESVADHLDRLAVGGDGVVAVARIFERGEAVALDASLADAEAARIGFLLHGIERH